MLKLCDIMERKCRDAHLNDRYVKGFNTVTGIESFTEPPMSKSSIFNAVFR